MSIRTAWFVLALVVAGLIFGAAVIATTPEFVCDGFGFCEVR